MDEDTLFQKHFGAFVFAVILALLVFFGGVYGISVFVRTVSPLEPLAGNRGKTTTLPSSTLPSTTYYDSPCEMPPSDANLQACLSEVRRACLSAHPK